MKKQVDLFFEYLSLKILQLQHRIVWQLDFILRPLQYDQVLNLYIGYLHPGPISIIFDSIRNR